MTVVARLESNGDFSIAKELIEFPDALLGGRNMLVNTNYSKTPEAYGGATITVTSGDPSSVKVTSTGTSAGVITDRVTDFIKDEVYTLSFEAKTTNVSQLNYNYYMDSNEGNQSLSSTVGSFTLTTDGQWRKYTKTFTSPSSRTQAGLMIALTSGSAGMAFELRKLKLEKGDVTTDWTPSPEDLGLSIPKVIVGFREGLTFDGYLVTQNFDENATVPIKQGTNYMSISSKLIEEVIF